MFHSVFLLIFWFSCGAVYSNPEILVKRLEIGI